MELSPFEEITPELARLVSGDPHVNLRLAALLRDSTMMRQQTLKAYRFWPIFRQFLRWELAQQCTEEQRRSLYDRGALYYELNEEYGPALEFYTKSGDTAKVSELLAKNAEMHPGMGHYLEMEPYYRALPEARVLQSPALMQAMSMLCAMRMDMDGSERWYAALRDRSRRTDDPDIKEIRGRLAWLDIALPQRGVEGMADLFPKVFALLRAKEIRLPAFSVTSTLPSLMNGGKDFSPWSKRDTLLYNSLRLPVEAVLGKDGVGLADCAIAESKFEKGEDVRDRVMKLLAILDHIRRDGTPDIEFAAVGLLVRVQMDAGHTQEAKEMLLDLRARFVQREETRFLPNLDAMLCRIALRQGNNDTAALWYRDKAPRNPQNMQTLKRYQYLTQAMAQLAMGDPQGALFTLAPLEPYFTLCRRYIDSISMNVLRAIAGQRLSAPGWRDHMRAALDTAREFGFVRSIGQYGAAVLPVLEACAWKGDRAFLDRVLAAARMQATCYPDFLSPTRLLRAPISEAEMQVLRLICAGHSNSEICAALNIRMSTAKTHVSHILDKLQVTRRSQVKAAAQRLHLIDP